jgi:hypothetical protein
MKPLLADIGVYISRAILLQEGQKENLACL